MPQRLSVIRVPTKLRQAIADTAPTSERRQLELALSEAGLLRANVDNLLAERYRLDIIEGLLEMRRARVFKAIWCEAGKISVVMADDLSETHQHLSWYKAFDLVQKFRLIELQ